MSRLILRAASAYLQVRPIGVRNAIRLYISYQVSILLYLLAPARFRSVGYLIPGRSKLTVTIGGVHANVRPGTTDLAIFATAHEPRTSSWFKVKPGDVVVDVGAHIGRYTLMAARYASRVVAVEPEPSNFSALLSNIRFNSYSNVIALCVALSDQNRKLPLHVAALGNMGSSSLEPESNGQGTDWIRGTVDVQCDTLDNIVARLNLESIDWLKIDVERHEIPVLEGAQETLARAKNVILEVSRGNEASCSKLMERAGLDYRSIDVGTRSSNWFLTRK